MKRKKRKFLFYSIETRKDVVKILRTCLEILIIVLVAWIVSRALIVSKTYKPYDKTDPKIVSGKDHGFIALSYFGVARTGTSQLIALKRLDEELTALKKLGYVTVTQEDVENYYYYGKPLPDKAVFLLFEDGRKDTVLFTEKLLEKLNDKATILTYAEKFKHDDEKFVSPKDLKKLEAEGFWELGTNGYRLSYINTFDRYNRFLGQMDSREFVEINQFIDRDYNHYLMDYIRDKDRVPTESTDEMNHRITRDYDLMEKIYKKRVGYVPDLYCLMHSNTGRYGNNPSVSEANAENLEGLFKMNINREGFSYNNKKSSIYDLTRLEPQSWWYTNHLLMRIRDDLPKKDKHNIVFEKGDKKGFSKWCLVKGAAEFKHNLIALTSESRSKGVLTLKKTKCQDMRLSCQLKGNKIGGQTIYMRTGGAYNAKRAFKRYLSVSVENNVLYVRERGKNGVRTLLTQDMYKLHDTHPVSIPEDSQDAHVAELKVRGKFSRDNLTAGLYRLKASRVAREKVPSVKDGAKEYVPELQISDPGDVKVEVTLRGNQMAIRVDNIELADDLRVSDTANGGIALESKFGGFQKSQRNIADDVYDGVFENLTISPVSPGEPYYDYTYHGFAKLGHGISLAWNATVNWFIDHL